MEKDFDGWNDHKKRLNARADAPRYHVREVWWCAVGINVGSEQDGKGARHARPVLVLRGLSRQTFLAVPLTTSARVHPLRPPIGFVGGKQAHALLSQMRVIDTKRLVRKIGYLGKKQFARIRKAARDML